MGEELEPFKIEGTEENPVEVQADDILNAIAEGRDINILFATIQGDLNIEKIRDRLDKDEDGRAIIASSIGICNSTFIGNVYFISCTFINKIDLSDSTFKGKSNFGNCNFRNSTRFYYTEFHGNVEFSSSNFIGFADFGGSIFIKEIHFAKSKFGRDMDFTGAFLARPALFNDVRIKENTIKVAIGNLFLREEKKIPVTKFIGFNTDTMMDSSSNPLLRRYIDDEQWIDAWRSQDKWHGFLYWIWEISSHCGRSFGLLAFWALLIIFAFGAIYANYEGASWLSCIDPKIDMNKHCTWFTPYYFSIVILTTLGFGDVTPTNLWGEIWVSLEVIAGYVLLGFLISVLANKVARRS